MTSTDLMIEPGLIRVRRRDFQGVGQAEYTDLFRITVVEARALAHELARQQQNDWCDDGAHARELGVANRRQAIVVRAVMSKSWRLFGWLLAGLFLIFVGLTWPAHSTPAL